jgi:hypothetical protein
MQITEPMTMFTDYLLAGWTLALAGKLYLGFRRHGQRSVALWAAALLFTSLASLAGGSYHGFQLHLSGLQQQILWKTVVYSVGLTSFCFLAGTVLAFASGWWRKVLLLAAGGQFLVYAVWMATHNDFLYIIYDYAPAMATVLILALLSLRGFSREAARWLIVGVVGSFAAAGVQQSGFALHQHFNHNDIYHVLQMGAVYFLYRGASLLRDGDEEAGEGVSGAAAQ